MTIDRSQIPGWGADLDRSKRPAVPMERTPQRFANVPWDQPEAQAQHVEVLQSVEYPQRTPVFGSACPPSGLSGMLRRVAFKRSENDMRHWMTLLLADRVNVVEGLFEDMRKSPRAPMIAALSVATIAGVYLMTRQRSTDDLAFESLEPPTNTPS